MGRGAYFEDWTVQHFFNLSDAEMGAPHCFSIKTNPTPGSEGLIAPSCLAN